MRSITGRHSTRLARLVLVLAAVLGVLAATAAEASACNKAWTGGGANALASNGNNWSPPGTPVATDDVCIPGSGVVIDLDLGLTVHSWTMGTVGSVAVNARAGGVNTGIAAPAGFTNGPHGSIVLDGGNGVVSIATSTGAGSSTLTNQGAITLESTSPTGSAAPPRLTGDLANTGSISVKTAAEYQGGYTLDNKGALELANGSVLSTTGAGPTTVVNDAGGSIMAGGTGYLAQGLGTFKQGAGTTSGAHPVILLGLSSLDYIGSGASHIEIHGGAGLAGQMSQRQSLRLLNGGGNSISTAAGGFTNNGAIVLDGSAGDVLLDMRDKTLTNNGTVTFVGGGGGGMPKIAGDVVNTGALQVRTPAALAGGTGPSTTLSQTGGATTVSSGASFDFGHAQAGFRVSGGSVTGTGTLIGNVVNTGGRVGPGTDAVLTLQGSYSQSGEGALAIPVSGAGAGEQGQLAVSGDATLGGILALHPSPSYASSAAVGDHFAALTFGGTRSGAFAHVTTTPALSGCKRFVATADDAKHRVSARVRRCGSGSPLKLTRVSLVPKAFRASAGTTLHATLNAAAKIRVVVTQRVRLRCAAHSGRECIRTVVRARRSLAAKAGPNRLRLRLRSLKRGRYTARIVAVDRAGRHSPTVRRRFKVKR